MYGVDEDDGPVNEDDALDAEEDVWFEAMEILETELEACSEAEKEEMKQRALEGKYSEWKRLRREGKLIENEESLAQKAQGEENERIKSVMKEKTAENTPSRQEKLELTLFCGLNQLIRTEEYF